MTERDLGNEVVQPWPERCDTCGHPLSSVTEGEYVGWKRCDPEVVSIYRRIRQDEDGLHDGEYEVVEKNGCNRYYLPHQPQGWVEAWVKTKK